MYIINPLNLANLSNIFFVNFLGKCSWQKFHIIQTIRVNNAKHFYSHSTFTLIDSNIYNYEQHLKFLFIKFTFAIAQKIKKQFYHRVYI